MQETPVQFLGRGRPLEKEQATVFLGFPCGSAGKKNPPAMQETWVQSLGWEDPLEKGKAAHSRYLMSFIGVLLLPQLCPWPRTQFMIMQCMSVSCFFSII